jgi:hypothetical protein
LIVDDDAISADQRARLAQDIARLPAELRREFDARYRAWHKTWRQPDIFIKSGTDAVRDSEEFRALVSLGPAIIPLVIEKLLQPGEFFALQVYDALQNRPELRRDDLADRGEQQRARATARTWLLREAR